MSFDLKNLQITTWYKAVVAIAAPILFLAIATNNLVIGFISGGALIFGIGEWINHPKRIELRGLFKITDYSWTPTPLGILLYAFGIILIAYGTFLAVTAQ